MAENYSIVITTINRPTPAIRAIAEEAVKLPASVILIGDKKSPKNFHQPGAFYLDLDAQIASGLRYASKAPTGHYARKNVGYLQAMRDGATVIIETDDDNIPLANFWNPRNSTAVAHVIDQNEWVNVYRYFADRFIWPRGLPLEAIRNEPRAVGTLPAETVYCPIQQGLANGDPDVDAIYRLTFPLPFSFGESENIALRGAWCPFNSQNTTWWKDAFPLLYLPFHCSFRMTDIWRSFVAQRIAYLNGWAVLFHAASVFQERNEHNLLKDFEDEIPGYLGNEKIRRLLQGLDLKPGPDNIPDCLLVCYRALIEHAFVQKEELALLDAWLEDITWPANS